MINLENVSVEYENGIKALEDVSLSVGSGEFVFAIGPTGSGKSTLLKLLYRQLTPDAGTVTIDNMDLSKIKKHQIPILRRKTGVVFQDYKLLPEKNLWENLAFVLRAVGKEPREIRELIYEILEFVGLTDQVDSFPNQMSGGEQQRAAIARALINNPKILIADEPTGNLDPETSEEIMELLHKINSRADMTMIVATHDKNIVNLMKRRVIRLENGKIIRDELEASYD